MYGLLVTTLPHVPGCKIKKILGLVYGLTVRTRGLGGQIIATLESLAGGEIEAYTSEAIKARLECIKRMVEMAKKIGANAIIGVDFETSDMLNGAATLFAAYGTAVIVEKVEDVEIELKDEEFIRAEEFGLASEEVRKKTTEEMLEELTEIYISIYGVTGKKKLENDIKKLVRKGLSQSEAIRELYRKVRGNSAF